MMSVGPSASRFQLQLADKFPFGTTTSSIRTPLKHCHVCGPLARVEDGGPSIQSLDREHGSRWRRSDKERKMYWRRKQVIDAIDEFAQAHGIVHDDAVAQIESIHVSHKLTLNTISKHLKEKSHVITCT
ncbi:TPA: hypothetical protein N0F65_004972 [Lagenidium giganteum]|uniref:Transcription activator GCR1-like domain-containing protein n=1 Tax=Lagenidium giganteum TaxID=4803 RepID=A0AAV2YJM1_9STRA|nr:TPA: hypothetical protein N0F65_004972 [Lagenidium giganteum]